MVGEEESEGEGLFLYKLLCLSVRLLIFAYNVCLAIFSYVRLSSLAVCLSIHLGSLWVKGKIKKDRWNDGQIDGWKDGQMDRWKYGQMDGLTDRRIDRRTDKQMDILTDGQIVYYSVERKLYIYPCIMKNANVFQLQVKEKPIHPSMCLSITCPHNALESQLKLISEFRACFLLDRPTNQKT